MPAKARRRFGCHQPNKTSTLNGSLSCGAPHQAYKQILASNGMSNNRKGKA